MAALGSRWRFEGGHRKHGFGGWREVAFGVVGHGMPCPYCGKWRQNDVMICAKHCEVWRVFGLAQAEAYATERQLRRPEASGTKNEGERTMLRCVLV